MVRWYGGTVARSVAWWSGDGLVAPWPVPIITGLAKGITHYRLGPRDGQAYLTLYQQHAFAQAPYKHMGWPSVSLIKGLERGMTKRIRNYKPGSRDGQAYLTLYLRFAFVPATIQAYP